MSTRLLTWNLQGREPTQLEEVAAVVRAAAPDLVALQEVQRRQAVVLARLLGRQFVWQFKHWPVLARREGLAVLANRPFQSTESLVLAGGAMFWSWRRRVALAVTVPTPDGPLRLVDVHLGADVAVPERVRQVNEVRRLLGPAGGVIAGDCNFEPSSVERDVLMGTGLADAWDEVRGTEPGPTNWPPGPRTGRPTQRLDYVFATASWRPTAADVPRFGDDGFGALPGLSDHLPLTVTLERA